MGNRFFLIVIFLSMFFGSRISSQNKNGHVLPVLKEDGSQGTEIIYINTPTTTRTIGETTTSTGTSFKDRSDAAIEQNKADIAVAHNETRRYDENLRAMSEGGNTPIKDRFTKFTPFSHLTEAQQRAFDYFLSLEMKPLKDINVQGLGSMQRVPDALKKAQEAIAANDYTKAMALFKQEAEMELPNRVIGEIPTNSSGNTKYVDLDKFKQLPPDGKQKTYNNILSQLEAKNNEKNNLYSELNELIQNKKITDDTFKKFPSEKRNNTEVVKKQNDIQQTFNKNSIALINEKADNEIEIRNLQKQIDAMKQICPDCIKN